MNGRASENGNGIDHHRCIAGNNGGTVLLRGCNLQADAVVQGDFDGVLELGGEVRKPNVLQATFPLWVADVRQALPQGVRSAIKRALKPNQKPPVYLWTFFCT